MARAAALTVAGALWLGRHDGARRSRATRRYRRRRLPRQRGLPRRRRGLPDHGREQWNRLLDLADLDASSAASALELGPNADAGGHPTTPPTSASHGRPDRRLEPGRRPGGGTRGGQGVLDRAAEPRRRQRRAALDGTAPARVIRASRAAAPRTVTTLPRHLGDRRHLRRRAALGLRAGRGRPRAAADASRPSALVVLGDARRRRTRRARRRGRRSLPFSATKSSRRG